MLEPVLDPFSIFVRKAEIAEIDKADINECLVDIGQMGEHVIRAVDDENYDFRVCEMPCVVYSIVISMVFIINNKHFCR
jgi:hypothetical protein